MNILITLLIAGILGLNLVASLRSQRDQLSLRHERFARLLLIWFVPVAGALLAFFMLRDKMEEASGIYPNEPNLGAEYVTGSGLQNDRGYIKSPDEVFHSNSLPGGGSHD